eukprot:scaffold40394_cov68-Phaeocystis_antarctica.AAC.1
MQEQVVPFAAPRVRAAGRPQSGVTDQGVRRSRAASWILPAETGSRASLPRSDHTTRTRRAWRRRAASWHRCLGVKKRNPIGKRPRGESGVDTGDVARLGQGAGPTRITQGSSVGELEPKLHFLGHPSGPTRPLHVPGAHIDAVGGSPGALEWGA